MPLNFSTFVIAPIERALVNLSAVLAKAEAHISTLGGNVEALVSARLAPDMLPLSGQVQRASDTAKAVVARLAGVDIPAFADDETTFAQLQDRIACTLAFVRSVDAAAIDGAEGKAISFQAGRYPLNFTGVSYLTDFALPNLYFHVTTAYAILRHNGAPLGKLDYIGPPGWTDEARDVHQLQVPP